MQDEHKWPCKPHGRHPRGKRDPTTLIQSCPLQGCGRKCAFNIPEAHSTILFLPILHEILTDHWKPTEVHKQYSTAWSIPTQWCPTTTHFLDTDTAPTIVINWLNRPPTEGAWLRTKVTHWEGAPTPTHATSTGQSIMHCTPTCQMRVNWLL